MGITGIDHVQIAAPTGCEADARRFFCELLGLTELEKPEALHGRGGAWFGLGEQQLHVGVDENFTPAVKAHPALRVDSNDLRALAVRLEDAGVEVLWDDKLAGVPRFYCSDPWGNRLELIATAPGL
jgi:catechol 2,3-dioxygenase-like lactoylglutathione lyase family enzyme